MGSVLRAHYLRGTARVQVLFCGPLFPTVLSDKQSHDVRRLRRGWTRRAVATPQLPTAGARVELLPVIARAVVRERLQRRVRSLRLRLGRHRLHLGGAPRSRKKILAGTQVAAGVRAGGAGDSDCRL